MENLLESMTDGVVAFDTGCRVTTINTAARQILQLVPPGFAAQIRQRRERIIIQIDHKGLEAIDELADLIKLLFSDTPLSQFPGLNAQVAADNAIHDLVPAHLQREEPHVLALLGCNMPGDVQSECGLAHAGPGRNHDEVSWLQPHEPVIQLAKPGADPEQGGIFVRLIEPCISLIALVSDLGDVLRFMVLAVSRDTEQLVLGDFRKLFSGNRFVAGFLDE